MPWSDDYNNNNNNNDNKHTNSTTNNDDDNDINDTTNKHAENSRSPLRPIPGSFSPALRGGDESSVSGSEHSRERLREDGFDNREDNMK